MRCRQCEHEQAWTAIHDRDVSKVRRDPSILHAESRLQSSMLQTSGPTCVSCQQPLGSASLHVQLERHIRADISRYYEGWLVCDDQPCGNRTRMMGVYGRRCLRPGCQGAVAFEVSADPTPLFDIDVNVNTLVYRRRALYSAALLCVSFQCGKGHQECHRDSGSRYELMPFQ